MSTRHQPTAATVPHRRAVDLSLPSGLAVVRELGRGSQTIVYRIRRGGDDYALKLLAATVLDDDRALADFRREAALLAQVNHPGIPHVHEVGTCDGRPYLVMDLIEGERLTDLIAAGPLAQATIIAIGIDIAEALAAAHRARLVHRDVKPDNILIASTGAARLIDFGMAARASTQHDGSVAGTFTYSAPEQSGMLKRPIDARADLYALGVVLYECATGAPPFTADDIGELLRMHAAVPAPDPRRLRAELSAPLAAIIAKLMAKDPDDRHRNATSLAADLRTARADPAAAAPGHTDDRAEGEDLTLIGRAGELAQLRERWDRARRTNGGAALIIGSQGAGKSRLARELTAGVRDQVVLHAQGADDQSVPLAPLRIAVERHIQSVARLPAAVRTAATERLRAAAHSGAALLGPLSPSLSALLHAHGSTHDAGAEQFATAVADFLCELARTSGGLLLHLDDVHTFDETTLKVLARLALDLPDAAVLVVATGRDDDVSAAALAAFRDALGPALDLEITLPRLGADDAASLVACAWGGVAISADVAAHLATRSDGNPYVLLEYLSAIVDAGLIRPCWGTWELDVSQLDELALPADAAGHVARRIDALEHDERRMLTFAAAIGGTVEPGLLAAVCGADHSRVSELLADAAWRRLVVPRADGAFAFLHSAIRAALLDALAPEQLQCMHAQIAQVLEARPADTAEHIYAVATQHRLAGAHADPVRAHRAAATAGRRALAEHAPAAALTFLEQAVDAATAAALDNDTALHEPLGLAYHRTGRFDDAITAFERALHASTDRPARGRILRRIARVHQSRWSNDEVLAAIAQALDELDRPLPNGKLHLALSTLWLLIAGYLVGRTGAGRGSRDPAARERLHLLASLYDAGAIAATRSLRPSLSLAFVLRAVYVVNRAGDCAENARLKAGLEVLTRALGLRRLADRIQRRATRIADALGDPRICAEVSYLSAFAKYNSGTDDGAALRRALDEHGRWLDAGDYVDGLSLLCWDHLLAGDTAQADALQNKAAARAAATRQAPRSPFLAIEPAVLAQRGRFGDAARLVQPLAEALAGDDGRHRANLLAVVAQNALEQAHYDDVHDAVAQIEAVGVPTAAMLPTSRNSLLFEAYSRIERCRTAADDDRVVHLRDAQRAVKAVNRTANRPLLRGHLTVIRASLTQCAGEHRRALDQLARAKVLETLVDAPLLAFEAARVRARAWSALGHAGEARRQAHSALAIAKQQGWPHRARWITNEFTIEHRSSSDGSARGHSSRSDVARAGIDSQRLAALDQVSRAASGVLDPDGVARIALDETIRILTAERAFLFLHDADTDELRPHLGRDGSGNDVLVLTNFSSTLVEQVRETRQAQVLTGTDEGAALGAQSVVVHGLRSIMAAPLLLDGRLLGVVYLDSRVAKGVFTVDDVSILAAITTHIAVALETARAAQLEVAVAAAHEQRDVAELLRDAMTHLSGTLEPPDVLERLQETTRRVVGADAAWLVLDEGAGLRIQSDDADADPLHGTLLDLNSDVRLRELIDGGTPALGRLGVEPPAAFASALSDTRSWMAVPLALRENRVGMQLLASRTPDAYGPAQSEIAATLAGQGMISYENARLFHRVRVLATIDELSGIPNRRHFFALAEAALVEAHAGCRPLVALMLDIDRFKVINDTHGHQVGDDVITAVAARLVSIARSGDVLGRYGGEEFGLVLAAADDDAAEVAERIRHAIAEQPIETKVGALAVTVSIGVASLLSQTEPLASLLGRADARLYDAKAAGRNCVAA